MQTFIIENNIPVPQTRTYCKTGVSAVLQKLEVGQSFLLDEDRAKKVSGVTYQIGKKYNRKFCTRKTEQGVRIWRVS